MGVSAAGGGRGDCLEHRGTPGQVRVSRSKRFAEIPLLENKLVIILCFTLLIVSLQLKWLEIPISLRAIVLV